MGVYGSYVLPHLISLACGSADVARQRSRVVPRATGRVLEVGMGPGFNLPFYDRSKVELVWGLEPSEAMRRKGSAAVEATDLEVRLLEVPAEEIPLDDDTVDTVLLTYTLCTIPHWEPALAQMRRVLKPGGLLLFSEHGEAPDASVRAWQRRIDPVWTKLAGGCHVTRPIRQMISSAGFEFVDIHSEYLPGVRVTSFHTWGGATIR